MHGLTERTRQQVGGLLRADTRTHPPTLTHPHTRTRTPTNARTHTHRDFESDAVRNRYWIGRLQRIYPDFVISTLWAFALALLVGCAAIPLTGWLFNVGQLLLVGAWVGWIPYQHTGNINGPTWFLVSLVWIWALYPWLNAPLKSLFRSDSTQAMLRTDSTHDFVLKMVALWVVSLAPWVLSLALSPYATSLGYASYEELMWDIKAFPLFRLPEFIMGAGIAVRLYDRREYSELRGGPDAPEEEAPDSDQAGNEWKKAGSVVLLLCLAALGGLVRALCPGLPAPARSLRRGLHTACCVLVSACSACSSLGAPRSVRCGVAFQLDVNRGRSACGRPFSRHDAVAHFSLTLWGTFLIDAVGTLVRNPSLPPPPSH